MHLLTCLTNLSIFLIVVSSAGLDIDLNELPPEDIDPNKSLTNLENEPVERSPSMVSNRKKITSIPGKRVRKMRSKNKKDEEIQKQRKRERNNIYARNYYQRLKETRPEKVEEIKKRKRQRTKEMSLEEKQKRRENNNKTYQNRKAERGFGNSYGMKLKEAKNAMKEKTATNEQIEIVLRNRRSKLRYYHSQTSRSKSSQTQSPAKRQKLTK